MAPIPDNIAACLMKSRREVGMVTILCVDWRASQTIEYAKPLIVGIFAAVTAPGSRRISRNGLASSRMSSTVSSFAVKSRCKPEFMT